MAKRNSKDRAIHNAIKWAQSEAWAESFDFMHRLHLEPVREALALSSDELIELINELGLSPTIFGAVFEDMCSCEIPEQPNFTDDFLKRRGWRESPVGRRYLENLRDSVQSLYEVVSIQPGKHCDVRDLLRGGPPVRVYEKQGTRQLAPWDCVVARVLPGHQGRIFSGTLLPISQESKQILLKGVVDVSDGLLPAAGDQMDLVTSPEEIDEMLRNLGPVFTYAWLVSALDNVDNPLPRLVNRDGEELVYQETCFPIQSADRDSMIRRLDQADALTRDNDENDTDNAPTWLWLEAVKQRKHPSADQSESHSIDTLYNGQTPIKATIKLLDDATLQMTTNSRARTEAGVRLLQSLLGESLGQPVTNTQTVEQLLKDEPASGSTDDEIDPAIRDELIHNMLDHHYRQLLSEPIPALDNKTPKRAVKTQKGRAQVVDWLKTIENSEYTRARQQGEKPYDIRWMWEALGIAQMRQ